MAKALIYREEGADPLRERIKALWEIVEQLKTDAPADLVSKLSQSLADLEQACRANATIRRGPHTIGYGIRASDKRIACASAMAILKEIDRVAGW
jgi:hypothetical protein